MILIFGGTTEGRLAASVCDQAGSPFYYSTLSDSQQMSLLHGLRLVGAMTADEIRSFCREKDVRCIVDASHPFAEGLHQSIAESGVSVIRLMRPEDETEVSSPNLIKCQDYDDLLKKLDERHPKRLLALSGVNTIAKLKDYWQKHDTYFRILPREESLQRATKNGFPKERLVFYSPANGLPTKDEEIALMKSVGCDAIVTKESGESGGYDAKVQAALDIGLMVFVIQAPDYDGLFPQGASLQKASGHHSLRRAIEKQVPGFFPLRTGLTTGSIATAAVQAAVIALVRGTSPDAVAITLPDNETIAIEVEHVTLITEGDKHIAEAMVRKDYSDDPDVTRGCEITAHVELIPSRRQGIRFLKGEGVGEVTLPGLGIPVGDPAINPIPRRMMEAAVRSLTDEDVDITLSVRDGEEMAKRTFNERVGVVGGISIIGTSGIVSPLSNEAFIDAIGRELEVTWAMGCDVVGLASGKQGEEALLTENPSLRVIHYGNFIGDALQRAYEIGFRHVILGIMIGKAVKLAEGNLNTHSHQVTMNKSFLTDVADSVGVTNASDIMSDITLARELWTLMPPAFFERLHSLCLEHCRSVFPTGTLDIQIIKNK